MGGGRQPAQGRGAERGADRGAAGRARPGPRATVEPDPTGVSGGPPKARRPRWKRWWVLALAVLVVLVVIVAYGYADTYHVELKKYTITSPDVPAAFDGTRIVLLTDIHRGSFFSQGRVRKLVERVERAPARPDPAGRRLRLQEHRLRGVLLRRARPPAGAPGTVRGARQPRLRRIRSTTTASAVRAAPATAPAILAIEAIQGAGIPLLDNQGVWVDKAGARIRVGGVGDYRAGHASVRPDRGGDQRRRLRPSRLPQPRLRRGTARGRRRPGALGTHCTGAR